MNIIVFALNGCPLAALGPYGNEWIATPNLDRLAAEGVVFDNHFSDCPDPAAARKAWRTGRHQWPTSETRRDNAPPDDLILLARVRGAHTVLVRANRPANDAHAEFYAGWDEMFDARPDASTPAGADALAKILPEVLDRLTAHPGWLLWIELDQLLPPWHIPQDVFDAYVEDLFEEEEADPSEVSDAAESTDESETDDESETSGEIEELDIADEADDDEEAEEPEDEEDEEEDESELDLPEKEPIRPWTEPVIGWFDRDDLASWELLHRSFAAALTVFDAGLGRIFDLLRARGLEQSAVWVVTADRGYPLGEHGLIGPFRPWLHEELVHVPLIVHLPATASAGHRVAELTQPADLMPTLAGWLGITPAAVDGLNLLPLIQDGGPWPRSSACSGLIGDTTAEWAVRTREWLLVKPGEQPPDDDPRGLLLFEKPDDRWEVNNLLSRHPERAEELEKILRDTLSSDRGPVDATPEG
ncbi:sulfatase [Fimbriiglobus ruber]|uniref:Choline-sulfatase n=1 Tax=Fimbriiglobus ruber TaxID=1908690 RepID=A0A225DPM8_9BACT|nr:sulfatase-like hydrolase/transferase [Fimbriiglobus ruber]OWK43352.1 Choline-sulfatase [Fimbriiglobus ruber]